MHVYVQAWINVCVAHGLTTPKTPTTVIPMVMLIVSEKCFTGRTSFLGNKSFSSALNNSSGLWLVQFNAATKPEMKKRH